MTIIKKGGYYVFSCRDNTWDSEKLGYGLSMQKLVAEGKYKEMFRRKYKRGTSNEELLKARPDLTGV